MQTETEKRTAGEVLLRSAACFCFACKAFRITDTKQLSACGTWMAIKPRDLKAMKNTRAGPGHGGGTPPTRRASPPGKRQDKPCGKACFPDRFSCLFIVPLGRHAVAYQNATAAHKSEAIANPVPQMRGPGGSSPWRRVWGRGGPLLRPQSASESASARAASTFSITGTAALSISSTASRGSRRRTAGSLTAERSRRLSVFSRAA